LLYIVPFSLDIVVFINYPAIIIQTYLDFPSALLYIEISNTHVVIVFISRFVFVHRSVAYVTIYIVHLSSRAIITTYKLCPGFSLSPTDSPADSLSIYGRGPVKCYCGCINIVSPLTVKPFLCILASGRSFPLLGGTDRADLNHKCIYSCVVVIFFKLYFFSDFLSSPPTSLSLQIRPTQSKPSHPVRTRPPHSNVPRTRIQPNRQPPSPFRPACDTTRPAASSGRNCRFRRQGLSHDKQRAAAWVRVQLRALRTELVVSRSPALVGEGCLPSDYHRRILQREASRCDHRPGFSH
jgi:hypothetical protein